MWVSQPLGRGDGGRGGQAGWDKIPSLSKEINFRLYAISNIGNDVRNECNEVSPILMT